MTIGTCISALVGLTDKERREAENSVSDSPISMKMAECPDVESLEDILMELAKWGQPRVGIYGSDGLWHCCIEVNVTAVGIKCKCEAESSYDCKTPIEAALECRKNLLEAVNTLGGQTRLVFEKGVF